MQRRNIFMSSILSIVAATGAATGAAAAKTAAPPTFASSELQADVDILERAYRELHPGLLRYLDSEGLNRSFRRLREEFDRPRTAAEAYLAYARFAATIRCGHTYANFYNQSLPIKTALFEQGPRLPFYFRWIDGRMIVVRDFTSPAVLPVGTEVSVIDGIDTRAILQHLLPLTRADGGNDAKRIDQLNVLGDDRYESFDVYFSLSFRLATGGLRLSVRRPGESGRRRLTVRPITYEQRLEPLAAREGGSRDGSEPVFEWRYLSDGSAYLRMPTWAMFERRWDWQSWLKEHLDELSARHAAALIVDLRGNEGGEDVGDRILERIVTEDLPVAGMKRLVRYRAVPQDLLPFLQTWDPSFRDWRQEASELEEPWPTAPAIHYYALAGAEANADARVVIHPVQPHFSGRLVVLVDAADSSATFQFAQLVQERHLGTLVGRPTGGSRRGINGGAFFFLQLPHSGIELDLPLIATFPRTPQPDAGLDPDVPVALTAETIASRTDPDLAAALRLLTQTR
jgi:hypothetical protein